MISGGIPYFLSDDVYRRLTCNLAWIGELSPETLLAHCYPTGNLAIIFRFLSRYMDTYLIDSRQFLWRSSLSFFCSELSFFLEGRSLKFLKISVG